MARLWSAARLAAVLALGAALLVSNTAEACRCLEVESAAASPSERPRRGRWEMDVAPTIHVTTKTTCAFSFAPDGSYLLFLQHLSGQSYTTARCMGNRGKVTDASRDGAK